MFWIHKGVLTEKKHFNIDSQETLYFVNDYYYSSQSNDYDIFDQDIEQKNDDYSDLNVQGDILNKVISSIITVADRIEDHSDNSEPWSKITVTDP